MSTKPENLFDVRVVQRNIAEKRVTDAEVDAYLASLPDEAENAEDSAIPFVMRTVPRRVEATEMQDDDEA